VTRCFYSRKGTNKLLREEGKGRRKERKKWATAPFKDIRRPFGVTPQSILMSGVTPHSILPYSRWRQGSRPSSWHTPSQQYSCKATTKGNHTRLPFSCKSSNPLKSTTKSTTKNSSLLWTSSKTGDDTARGQNTRCRFSRTIRMWSISQ